MVALETPAVLIEEAACWADEPKRGLILVLERRRICVPAWDEETSAENEGIQDAAMRLHQTE